jgi:TPR repeat protein
MIQFGKRPIEMAPGRRAQNSEMEEGRKYFCGIRTKRNYPKAFPLLLRATRQGYVHAQFMVGCAYRDGLGTKKTLAQSRRWWTAAAKRDHPGAIFNLALDYDYGRGIRPNPRKAFGLYKRGAKFGDREAQCNLAVVYLDGRGTNRSLRQGTDPKAQDNLGRSYLDGEELEKDKIMAKMWLTKAARQGHGRARNLLRAVRENARH